MPATEGLPGNMGQSLRVLIVEDQASDADLMIHELERAGFNPTWERVDTEAGFRQALEPGIDVILADYNLPQFTAPRALEVLNASGLRIPFIVVTGSISEEVAVECMKNGAADYLLKDRLARLGPAVNQALESHRLARARAAAEAERDRLARVLESTTDLVGMADRDGRSLYMNRAGQAMLGLEPGAHAGRTIRDFHTEAVWDLVENEAIPHAIEHGVWNGETEFVASDGSRIPVLQVILAHYTAEGSLEFLSTIARDISNLKAYQHRIREQLQRLRALRAIDLAITASLDPRLTFEVLLDQLTSVLKVDAAAILLFDPEGQTLNYAAGRGFNTPALQHSHLRLGEGQAGRAALAREPVHILRLQDHEEAFSRSPLVAAEGFVSYFAVPLVAKGQVKGVLELFHRSVLDPNDDWTEFLEALAGQAAIAIDNARLFDNLQRVNVELMHAYDETIEGWARALELRNIEIEGHARRVTDLTSRLARRLGIPEGELSHMRRGALLHDIGKMAIPDHILLKPDALTEDEWVVMREHPAYAFEMLSPIEFLRSTLDIPYAHHEKWDGSGYPRGLKAAQIPRAARIFAVVDVWDALTSDRPYRSAWPEHKALDYLRQQADTHFDPVIATEFLTMVEAGELDT